MPGIGQDAISGASSGAALGPWGALAGGILGAGVGLFQKASAKKWLKNNPYPIEQMPSEITENQNLARQEAATGLPPEQYAKAMKDIQRQQLMALRGAQDRRGGLGSISAIQQGTNDATLNLNVADANAKLSNERNLMGVNNQVAGWKDKLFQQNVMDKYNRDYNYRMGEQGAGNQNLTGGADKILAGLFGGNFGGGGGLFSKKSAGTAGGGATGGYNPLYPI